MKFLIIEDEVIIAELIKDYLISFGYTQIEMAHHKTMALELINVYKPNLVLLDVRMETEKVGIELGDYLVKYTKIPFIYITAHSDTKLLNEIMKTNPAGYLNKPIKKADLLATIIRLTKTIAIENDALSISSSDKNVLIRIEAYFHEIIFSPFEGIDSLSKKFSISSSKLQHNFKLVYNTTVNKYYTDLQMKIAFDLIKKEKLMVKEVSFKFGYESPGRFSEAFKKVHGILPSEL